MSNIMLPLNTIIRSASYQFRTETSDEWIEELREVLESGQQFTGEDAIKVGLLDGSYYLYDGFHRFAAMDAEAIDEAEVQVVEVEKEYDLMVLAIRANAKHGKRNSKGDYIKMVDALLSSECAEDFMKNPYSLDTKRLSDVIGCTVQHVRSATKKLRDSLEVKLNDEVLMAHEAGLSVRKIADGLSVTKDKVQALVAKCRETKEFPNATPEFDPMKDRVSRDMSQMAQVPMQEEAAEEEVDYTRLTIEPAKTFDVQATEIPKMESARDTGDECDKKDPEAVRVHEEIETINKFMKFIPELSDEDIRTLKAKFDSEAERRGLV